MSIILITSDFELRTTTPIRLWMLVAIGRSCLMEVCSKVGCLMH